MDPDAPVDPDQLDPDQLASDRLDPWVWAFLGEFPAAGLALRPTLRAWEEARLRRAAVADRGLPTPTPPA